MDQEAIKKRPEDKEKLIKRIILFFGILIVGILMLSSCTKAFTTDADKANQIYAALYGQDNSHGTYDAENNTFTNKGEYSTSGKSIFTTLNQGSSSSSGVGLPSDKFQAYISVGYTFDFTNLTDGAPTVTPVIDELNGGAMSKAQTWLNDNLLASTDIDRANSIFGEEIVQAVKYGKTHGDNGWTDLKFDVEEDRNYYISCFQSAKAVTLFGGYKQVDNTDQYKVTLWYNMDNWFISARTDLGINYAPTEMFVTLFKSTMNTKISTNRAGLNTSGTGGLYGQEGNQVYISNKTWGQAFSEYGFWEGLLVYPIGWLVNAMVTAFGAGTGWAELAAIFLITVMVRAILVVFSIFTSRSQTRMTELQPEVAMIQAKYPNNQTDPYERQQMSKEVSALYKKNKVKPWLQFVMLIVQFPIFICVWSALEGAATLSSGSFFGVELTAKMSDVIMNTTGTSVAMGPRVLAGIMLVIMFIAQFFSMMTGQWFNKWKTKKFSSSTIKPQTADNAMDPNKMSRIMTIVMMIFMVFMGINLPAGMSMYWFFGAIISIVQVFITEAIAAHDRHKKTKNGDSLSALRRSKHHDSVRKSR